MGSMLARLRGSMGPIMASLGAAGIVVIFLYAFNESTIQSFPIENWSTKWFDVAWHNDEVRTALWNSVKVGIGATVVALLLGTMAAFAVSRFFVAAAFLSDAAWASSSSAFASAGACEPAQEPSRATTKLTKF